MGVLKGVVVKVDIIECLSWCDKVEAKGCQC